MIKYTVKRNGIIISEWTSDFADGNYTEENWGVPQQIIPHAEIPEIPAIPAQGPIPAVFDLQGVEISPMIPAVAGVDAVPAIPAWEEIIPGYTVEFIDITAELAKEAALKLKLDAGKINREKCDKVRDFIGGLNSGNLTIEQIDQMELAFAPIQIALINLRPDKARAMILAVVPDGVMVTQETKDTILEILA